MRRVTAVWGVCSLLLVGSFAALIVEDRRLGVALPYSVPIAFAIALLAASVLFALGQLLLARRPIRHVEPAVRVDEPERRRRTPRTAAEGVVLLDVSRLAALSGQRT
jgi:hypothetical protein